MYDETLQMLRDQLGESQNQVNIIITSLIKKESIIFRINFKESKIDG